MTTTPVKVMVVDDHPLLREGLRSVISAVPGFELVAAAATGSEAITAAAVHRPDVVVMDLNMPDLDGVQTTTQLLAAHPDMAILILTMYDEDELRRAALRAGARGYLLKGATHTELVQALRSLGRRN